MYYEDLYTSFCVDTVLVLYLSSRTSGLCGNYVVHVLMIAKLFFTMAVTFYNPSSTAQVFRFICLTILLNCCLSLFISHSGEVKGSSVPSLSAHHRNCSR